jgi:hypothetical protein
MDLKGLALSVVILIITVSIGSKITSTVRDTMANTSEPCTNATSVDVCYQPEEYNSAYAGNEALGDFSDWYAIIIITGVGAAVLGMLGMFNREAQ